MKSKRDTVLGLFFNTPKQWHFEELRRKAQIGKPQLARWLKVFQKEGLIKRIKRRGKMPYYVPDFECPGFKVAKRQYAKEKLIESGLLEYLAGLDARAVILFGSFTREDWYDDSDVDIFIYDGPDKLELGTYERRLGRRIEIHHARDARDMRRMEGLLPFILSGDFVKGSAQAMGVEMRA